MILAIDPGVLTGVALRLEDGSFMTASVRNKDDLYGYIRSPVATCVYETFQAQMISGPGLHTVRLVGAIEALCWREDIKVVPQTPQQRKAYVTKAIALLHQQSNTHRNQSHSWTDHEADALAHLLAYEARMAMIATPA